MQYPKTDTPNWADMCAQDHFVQFYEEDRTIVEAVAAYFAFGVRFAEGCVLVGTEGHNEAIKAGMRDLGCDVDKALADGQFTVLDAADTLSRFMIDGMPDKKRFEEVIGTVITAAKRGDKPPRVF